MEEQDDRLHENGNLGGLMRHGWSLQPTLLKLLRSDRRECAYLEFMVLVGHIYVSLQDVYCFICSLSPKLGGWSPSAIHAGRET